MKQKFIFSAVVLVLMIFINSMTMAQWSELSTGTSLPLYSASAPNNSICFASGPGVVIKTTNAGTSPWLNVTPSGPYIYWTVFAYDANLVFLCATDTGYAATYIMRSSNGGSNWQTVMSMNGAFFDAVWMYNANNGFMYGDPVNGRWLLYKTTNGGLNWDSTGMYLPQLGGEWGWNNGIYYDGTATWFATGNPSDTGRIYKSTNLTAWTYKNTPGVSGTQIIWFNNATTGFACQAKTTDAGNTWFKMTSPDTNNISTITGYNNLTWCTASNSRIYKSTNFGVNWVVDYNVSSGSTNEIIRSRTPSVSGSSTTFVLYCIRDNGAISKSTQTVVGIKNICSDVPSTYNLKQNFPNPFNPTTNIQFDLPKSSFVKLVVYDALGREVESLVNEIKQAGIYSVDFNGSDLTSGVYYYKIQAGDFTDTKRMMLIK